jgi:hypothetical protein
MTKNQDNAEVDPKEWVSHFVELQLKELNGAKLTREEENFLDAVEIAAQLAPGALEETVLEYGLSAAGAEEEAFDVVRIAAYTAESQIYLAVNRSLQNAETKVFYEIGERQLELFQIDDSEGVVEPLYQDGYRFVIETKGSGKQLVSKYGGIFISIEDLKKMTLEYDAETRLIHLYEK